MHARYVLIYLKEKQYALLRSTGVRVGGRVHGAPQPRHGGGLCPPATTAPPPMRARPLAGARADATAFSIRDG